MCRCRWALALCQWHENAAGLKAEVPRLKRASLKSEMIARACHLTEKPKLIDATAGLGHDSLLMAYLGANVTLVERHPILFTLLESSKEQALQDAF